MYIKILVRHTSLKYLKAEYLENNFYNIFYFSLIFQLRCSQKSQVSYLIFLFVLLPFSLTSASKQFNEFSSRFASTPQIRPPFPTPLPEPQFPQQCPPVLRSLYRCLPNPLFLVFPHSILIVLQQLECSIPSESVTFLLKRLTWLHFPLKITQNYSSGTQVPFIRWLLHPNYTLPFQTLPILPHLRAPASAPKSSSLAIFQVTAFTSPALSGDCFQPPKFCLPSAPSKCWVAPGLDTYGSINHTLM